MKAFPTEHPLPGTMDLMSDGMDLRDYFAAKAMVLTRWKDAETSAKFCYIVADALMKAREDV